MASVKVFGADGSLSQHYVKICERAGIEPVGWIGRYLCGSPDWLSDGVPNLGVLRTGDVHSVEAAKLFWRDVASSLCLSDRVIFAHQTRIAEYGLGDDWVVGYTRGVPVFRYSEYDGLMHLNIGLRPYAHFLFSSESESFSWVLDLFNGDRVKDHEIKGDTYDLKRKGIERDFWIDVLCSIRVSPVLIGAAGYADAVRSKRSIVEYQGSCEQVLKTFGVPYSWSDIEKLLKK